MEYGNVVSRAWQIAWREKKLWVLGFMTSLGLVAIGASQIRWIGDREELGLEAVLGLVWILILIAMVEVSVVARGGLIAGVLQVEGEGSTGFRQAWRVGRKWFWTLFGIALLAGLPTVVLGLVSGGVSVVLLVLAALTGGPEASEATPWLLAAGSGCGGLLCCGAMIVALPMGVIQMLAERAAVLEGLRGIDAFKRGWQVLKANLSTTLVLGVIFLAIGVIVVVLVIVALVIIDLSEGPTKILGHVDPKPWMVIPFCGGPIVIVLSALIGGVASAFASATWTLAYREMIRRTDQPAAVVQPGEV